MALRRDRSDSYRSPAYWRAAWARRCRAGPPDAQSLHLDAIRWEGALEAASAGDWSWLDDLLTRVRGHCAEASLAPPPALWPLLNAFFADLPPRTKGLKRRVDPDVCNSIRMSFAQLVTKHQVLDVDGSTYWQKALTQKRAREILAARFELSDETVRNIVERRATYKDVG